VLAYTEQSGEEADILGQGKEGNSGKKKAGSINGDNLGRGGNV